MSEHEPLNPAEQNDREPAFRTARLFDSIGPGDSPQVDRPVVPEDEVEAVADYLTKAPIVLAARSLEADLFDPARPAKVPLTYLTDGTWIWPGGVGYYLRAYRVPPEPELVEHIRSREFRLPEVDDYTRDAAAATITGASLPARPEPVREDLPRPDPQEAVRTEAVRTEEASRDGERRALDGVRARLDELSADPRAYSIETVADNTWCMVREGDGWAVFWSERGGRAMEVAFASTDQAAAYLLGTLLLVPSRMHPYGAPPQPAAQATGPATQPDMSTPSRQAALPRQYGGPIEPLPDEPPLTLFQNLREIELAVGTEMDRFGDPSGNLTYAAGTHYSQRSLPPEWANRPYHIYRVRHPLRILIGTAIPWFEQPGGGTGYFLPVSIADLAADGALIEIERPPGS